MRSAVRIARAWITIGAVCASPLLAQTSGSKPEAVPLLRTNCLPCHSRQNHSSGLSLDSREEILLGGNRGSAVNAGMPGASLIVQAIEQNGDLKMPPGRRLADEQIAVIRAWIEQGMVWPEQAPEQKRRAPTIGHFSRREPCRRPR